MKKLLTSKNVSLLLSGLGKFKSELTSLMLCITIIFNTNAQVKLNYYLPEIKYDQNIPTPQSILKYQIGEWHITHDQLVNYLEKLCESSPNCKFQEFARTHEHRPLVNLIISSESNLENLDDELAKHKRLVDPSLSSKVDLDDTPLVLYQGYSIHGNESSGSNACPLVAYYLLAGQSDYHTELLDNTVIVIDPSYNPDGLQRFSTWANSHKHKHLVSDPISREFNEVWPGGRTNHYWFDLNRDWIFNIHPSSKGRIENFHYLKPDVLTDHHEMGSNSTFFFQPGVPSRTNPNTPQINQVLTEEIGNFHASALDSIGSLYFSKERFDDFYYGKGSTYPDINGCIGILFEQASARGHLRRTSSGELSFPFTVRNQVVTSLSTHRAALAMKNKILEYKRDFYRSRYEKSSDGFFIFSDDDDYKLSFFLSLLDRHQINVYRSPETLTLNGQSFAKNQSYLVPKKQIQGPLVNTIFEKVRTFKDSIFYDVSAWTLPLAFNMKYGESNKSMLIDERNKVTQHVIPNKEFNPSSGSYALVFEWEPYLAPTLLYKLQEKDIDVRVMTEDTELSVNDAFRKFDKGSVLIPLNNQNLDKEELIEFVKELSAKYSQNIFSISSGQSRKGKSLGSGTQKKLEMPKVAMLVGTGVNAYEAGATWYQMDHRLEMPIVMLDKNQIQRAELSKFNVIILPDGNYDSKKEYSKKIKEWVTKGGTLIAMRRAIDWTSKMEMFSSKPNIPKNSSDKTKSEAGYTTLQNYRGAQVIGGAIFQSKVNLDHPLFYGYKNDILPVFKKGTQFLKVQNEVSTPMIYTSDPVSSGYASKQNIKKAKNAAGIICAKHGKGKIIAMVDNPNFRGYWLGGSKLFANALFFNELIDRSSLQ